MTEKNTRSFWEEKDYHRWEGPIDATDPFPWATRRFMQRILPRLKGKRVLDLGCGPGNLTAYFAEVADRVVGLDFSESAVATARKRCRDQENVSFEVANLLEFTSPETFDVITGRMILHEIMHDDTPRLLERLDALLADGGYLYLHENSYYNAFARFVRSRLVGRYGVPKHGSEHELPFDEARFRMYADFFPYCDRFVEAMELGQKVYDYLVPLKHPAIARLFLAGDQVLTAFHARTGLLDNWSYCQSIYASRTVPRSEVLGSE